METHVTGALFIRGVGDSNIVIRNHSYHRPLMPPLHFAPS